VATISGGAYSALNCSRVRILAGGSFACAKILLPISLLWKLNYSCEVCHSALQRDLSPRGYKRFLAFAWHYHVQPFVDGFLHHKFGFVLVHDFLHRGVMFGC